MRKIAESTVRRLSLYLRFLEEFEDQGAETVSSDALATRGGTTSAQVRKDLSFFGSFGKRGLGYQVPALISQIREILGLNRRYRVIVIGAGKIGSALVQYGGFRARGFDLVAIYDNDPKKIGKQWDALVVRDVAHLEKDLHQHPPTSPRWLRHRRRRSRWPIGWSSAGSPRSSILRRRNCRCRST